MVRKHVQNSHETLSLRGGGLECRKLGRRLVIWHTTQLEILHDDGGKHVKRSHETLPLIRAGLDCRRLGRRLVIWHKHYPARNSAVMVRKHVQNSHEMLSLRGGGLQDSGSWEEVW